MAADGGVPQLPWTIRSGHAATRTFLTLMRVRGVWLLVPITLAGVVAGVSDGLHEAVAAVTFGIVLIGSIVLATFLGVLLYSRSTITVTHTELAVRRLRRRVLQRSDLGEVVIGFFTVQASDPLAAQVAFTRRDGTLFATLPAIYWPGDDLDRLTTVLGVQPRRQAASDDRLRPFWIRRPWATVSVAVVVLLVLIVGGIVAADRVAVGRQRADARAAQAAWTEWRDRHLTAEMVPGLVGVEGGVEAGDDEGRPLRLRTSVSVGSSGGETDPATYAAAIEGTCGFQPEGDRPFRAGTRLDVGTTDGTDVGRTWTVECGPAEKAAAALVDDLAGTGWGDGVGRALVQAESYDDFDGGTATRLEVSAYLRTEDETTLRRVLQRGCALPGADSPDFRLSASYLEADGPVRDTGTVDCGDLDAAVAAWLGTAPTR